MTFCFRKNSFVQSRSETYYALLLGYFRLKFLTNICHCVYWVLADIWAADSSHKISNIFFYPHCQSWKEGSFVCETVWFFSLVNTHLFELKFIAFCPKFSGDSYVEIQKKLFRENFSEILCKARLSSTKTSGISPYFLQLYSASVLHWKNSHKYFHMLFAPR